MRLEIKINLKSKSFGEETDVKSGGSIAEILYDLASKIDYIEVSKGDKFELKDKDGNECGHAKII